MKKYDFEIRGGPDHGYFTLNLTDTIGEKKRRPPVEFLFYKGTEVYHGLVTVNSLTRKSPTRFSFRGRLRSLDGENEPASLSVYGDYDTKKRRGCLSIVIEVVVFTTSYGTMPQYLSALSLSCERAGTVVESESPALQSLIYPLLPDLDPQFNDPTYADSDQTSEEIIGILKKNFADVRVSEGPSEK